MIYSQDAFDGGKRKKTNGYISFRSGILIMLSCQTEEWMQENLNCSVQIYSLKEITIVELILFTVVDNSFQFLVSELKCTACAER